MFGGVVREIEEFMLLVFVLLREILVKFINMMKSNEIEWVRLD